MVGRRAAASVVGAAKEGLVPLGDLGDLGAETHVDVCADVAGAQGLDGKVGVDFPDEEGGVAIGEVRFPVQKNGDGAVGVNSGLVAAQLGNLADDADVLVDKGVEVGCGDARRGNVFRHYDRIDLMYCCFEDGIEIVQVRA